MRPPPDQHHIAAAFWSQGLRSLLRSLDSRSTGLTDAQSAQGLARYGPNRMPAGPSLTGFRLFAHQFESPLVLILLVGASISLLLRQWIDAAIILAIVMGSGLLGFTQEHRASRRLDALRLRVAPMALVLRNGAPRKLPTEGLVPGDVILLSAGNRVPADGRILRASDCLVEEASLTGESFPASKCPGQVAANAAPADRSNAVFMGTSVRSGTATVLVVNTGANTVFGQTAQRLASVPPPTGFERGLADFGALLLRVMVVMVIFVLATNHWLGRPAIDSLLFAVALAVGLSPELLPAIVSVTLSHGAREMARRGTIVRRLQAIENLGGMDVLCIDKTGTLTEGRVELASAVDPQGQDSTRVLRLAWLNAALEAGIDNPLDSAVNTAGEAKGLQLDGCVKVAELPYDFSRRRLSIILSDPADPGMQLLVTKGAVAQMLEVCNQARIGERAVTLDEAVTRQLLDWTAEQGGQGLRVLAVAAARRPTQAKWQTRDESGLIFEGFLCFRDPARPDAARTLTELRELGVNPRLVTGDNRWVAAHLAQQVGMNPQALLTGAEMRALDDAALVHRVEQTELFVEVDPQQKERIVRALQARGHLVGFLGDGINDTPALHAADVGISVDQAVDVARESADVVLLARDLDVLRDGVLEGRRTFDNTLKYILITTSANFGNMLSMAIATPLLPFLPLAAKQILLNNFLSDLPNMALATDRVDHDRLRQPQRWDVAQVRRFMLVFGLISTVFDLLTFGLLRHVYQAGEAEFQTGWFMASLLTELAVVMVLRTAGPAWRSRPGALLAATTLAVGALAIALPWMAPAAAVFGLVPLPLPLLGAILAVVAGYVATTEVAKRIRLAH